jgi:hypothetical protein
MVLKERKECFREFQNRFFRGKTFLSGSELRRWTEATKIL